VPSPSLAGCTAPTTLISGDDAVKRITDMTRDQGAEVVVDFVAVNPTLAMAAQVQVDRQF
jgi:propanol-preferring alcohol dehydrogenase